MRLVVKYGGLTIQTPKKIKIAAKQATNEAKKNQIIIVCSAIGDTTDLLLKISQLVRKNDVNGAKTLAASIINLHKKTAQQTISKAMHEITPRSLDYLISFGERFSSKIFSQAVADLGKKTQPMTGREAGIVTDSNYGNCKPLMNTTRLRVFKNIESLVSKKIIPVIGGFSELRPCLYR